MSSRLIPLFFLLISSVSSGQIEDLSFGTPETFDIMTWNIEQFPKNGQTTVNYVSDIIQNLENVIITVEDNGPGFSKGSLKKVFDRFYTDRPKNEKFGNHSGLGLSISKQIIEAHNGSIEALNRLNQKNECLGGSVKVTFPEVKN